MLNSATLLGQNDKIKRNYNKIKNRELKLKIMITKKFNNRLATQTLVISVSIFIVALIVGTIIQNLYSQNQAYELIYSSILFLLLFGIISILLIINIFTNKLYQKKSLPILTLFVSVIFIILGAFIAKEYSYEGKIFCNTATNKAISSKKYLNIEILDNKQKIEYQKQIAFSTISNSNFSKTWNLSSGDIEISYIDFIKNAKLALQKEFTGSEYMEIMVSNKKMDKKIFFIRSGDSVKIEKKTIGFNNKSPVDIQITSSINHLVMVSKNSTKITSRADTLAIQAPANQKMYLESKTFYKTSDIIISIVDYVKHGEIVAKKIDDSNSDILILQAKYNNLTKKIMITNKQDVLFEPTLAILNNAIIKIKYGNRSRTLPFEIKLNKIIQNPYQSLTDREKYLADLTISSNKNNKTIDYLLGRNNPFHYSDFIVYKKSYDSKNEKIILKVKEDHYSTIISSIGYYLLMLFIFLLIAKWLKSPTKYDIKIPLNKISSNSFILILLLIGAIETSSVANSKEDGLYNIKNIDKQHAKEFGMLQVQYNMRVMPINSIAKIVEKTFLGKSNFLGLDENQILLSMMRNKKIWQNTKLIEINSIRLKEILSIKTDKASYNNLVGTINKKYKLSLLVKNSLALPESKKTTLELEIIAVDKKFRLLKTIFDIKKLHLFPVSNSNIWDNFYTSKNNKQQDVIEKYIQNVDFGIKNSDWKSANISLEEIKKLQQNVKNSNQISNQKSKFEILYNRFDMSSIGYYMLTLTLILLVFTEYMKNRGISFKIPTILSSILILLLIVDFISNSIIFGFGIFYNQNIFFNFTSLILLATGIYTYKKSILPSIFAICTTLIFLCIDKTELFSNPYMIVDSFWFVLNYISHLFVYAFLLIAGFMGLLGLISWAINYKQTNISICTQEYRELQTIFIYFGLLFLILQIASTAIYQNQFFGYFWGWSTKENISLIVLFYLTVTLNAKQNRLDILSTLMFGYIIFCN
jgi:hypothetical protein